MSPEELRGLVGDVISDQDVAATELVVVAQNMATVVAVTYNQLIALGVPADVACHMATAVLLTPFRNTK